MVTRVLGLAAAIAAAGCVNGLTSTTYQYSCNGPGDCPDGWNCIGRLCVSDGGAAGTSTAGTTSGSGSTTGGTTGGSAGCLAQFTSVGPIQVGPGVVGLAAADFNHDGFVDLAVNAYAEGSGNGAGLVLLLNDGGGGFVTAGPPDTSLALLNSDGGVVYAAGLVAADFNGDQWPDLALSYPQENSLAFALNAQTLGFRFSTNGSGQCFNGGSSGCAENPDAPFMPLAVGYVDGGTDAGAPPGWWVGIADLLASDDQANAIHFDESSPAFSDVGYSVSPVPVPTTGIGLSSAAGTLELCVASADSVETDLGGATRTLGVVGASDVQLVDLNHDGLPDVVFVSPSTSQLGVVYGSAIGSPVQAPSTFSTVYDNLGHSPQSLVVADFNQDGLLDVATVNTQSITILAGLSDGGFQAVQALATSRRGAAFIVAADFGGAPASGPPWLAVSYAITAASPTIDLYRNGCQ